MPYQQSRGFLDEIHLYGPTGLQQCTETPGSLNIKSICACLLGPVLNLLTGTGHPCLLLSQALCAVGTALTQEPVVSLGWKGEPRHTLLQHQERKQNPTVPRLPAGKPRSLPARSAGTSGGSIRARTELPTSAAIAGTAVPHQTHSTTRAATTCGHILAQQLLMNFEIFLTP